MEGLIYRWSAIAIPAEGGLIPFGPTFSTEEEVWKWLHYDCDLCPEHKEIIVMPFV